MTLDPQTALYYRVVLVAAGGVLCLLGGALIVWIVRQLASMTAEARGNVDHTVGWLAGYKTHLVNALGGLATLAWIGEYLSDKTYFALAGLLGFTALSTLRSGTAKAEKLAALATVAADEAASIATATQQTVKAAVKVPVTPERVSEPAKIIKDSS